MNGASGFQVRRSLPPHHHCANNGTNTEQVSGSFSGLTASKLFPQASTQSQKRFLTPFSCSGTIFMPMVLKAI